MRIEESIGLRIKAERERRGWSLAELGRRVGRYLGRDVIAQAVWQAEAGRREFKASQLIAYALALEVPITELVAPQEDDLMLSEGYSISRDDALVLFAPGSTPGVGATLADLMDKLDQAADELRRAREGIDLAEQVSSYGADLLGGLLEKSRRRPVRKGEK